MKKKLATVLQRLILKIRKSSLWGMGQVFFCHPVHVAPNSPLVIQKVLSRKQLLYAGKVWIKMREKEMKRSDW